MRVCYRIGSIPSRNYRLKISSTTMHRCRRSFGIARVRGFSSMAESVTGQSGKVYTIERILQDKGHALGRVYFAKHGTNLSVLKEIPQDYRIRTGIYQRVCGCSNLRSLIDAVPDRNMFVFEYLDDDLLHLAQIDLPTSVIKRILKAALRGLAALHEQDIVHNDVKANNVMVQIASHVPEVTVGNVKLIDLEDAAHLPPGSAVVGSQVGNIMWRSPEAHAMGPVWKPSDMFSFGIVCIFAMTRILPFYVDESELSEGVEKLAVILERQISYFADENGLNGLLQHLGNESEWVQIFQVIKDGFGEAQPREPFALWKGLNIDQEDLFKDLVVGLTNFDPNRRLTAHQALDHAWFQDLGTT